MPQTSYSTNNKSKTTGKRIAIKNRNFKIMDNIIKNQKNNITKIWDNNKYGIIINMHKLTFRNSKIKSKRNPILKKLSRLIKIKFKQNNNYRIKILTNINKISMITNLNH